MAIKQIITVASFLFVFIPSIAVAHQPVLEPVKDITTGQQGIYFNAVTITDPTKSSQAVYGVLAEPTERDVFVFIPEQSVTIPIELLVPIRPANELFKPDLFVAAKQLPANRLIDRKDLNLDLPDGYQVMKISNSHSDGEFYEPFSAERYWKSEQINLDLQAGQNYFLVVSEPNSQRGDYSIGLGTVEDFSNTSMMGLLQNVFSLKLGLVGNQTIPWIDLLGTFLVLAGLIIGLGAVTVIDTLGFLGLKSEYWTESTIRAHKVTKPLIWLGLLLLVAGFIISYRDSWLTGVGLFQVFLVIVLALNGLFLTFYISPRLLQREKDGEIAKVLPDSMQSKIAISFIISFLSWWTLVFLTAWYFALMS